jgi:epoxyqueuosine reductase
MALSGSRTIKRLASEHGFAFCGISKAEFLENEAPRLEQWLSRNYNGKMAYMANHFDKRLDPTKLVPGSKSVVSLLYNYSTDVELPDDSLKISRYAYGDDYHFVIKDKLRSLLDEMRLELGEINGRVFVDSAPVMDKVWAARSGMGWVGKHTNLINKEQGSWFFISELIIDIELSPDGPIKDYCGTCTRCIDACPTDAIVDPYVVDANKCISYLTIELRDEVLPDEFAGKMENWMFGCDICQEVCPWNRFASKHNEPAFEPSEGLINTSVNEWNEMTEDVFQEIFKKSAVMRTGYKGLKRNLNFLKKVRPEQAGKNSG